MNDENKEFPTLNEMFKAAKAIKARPSESLMARISDDAGRVQSGFHTPQVNPARPGWAKQLYQVLGGWPALGGLGVAAATGLWIGVFPPDTLSTGFSQLTQAMLVGNDTAWLVDITPGSEFDLGEEAL